MTRAPRAASAAKVVSAPAALRFWCLPADARVATAVSGIAAGDVTLGMGLLTVSGKFAKVTGIERMHGTYRRDEEGRPDQPLRVRANAFNDGEPQRDTVFVADQVLHVPNEAGDGVELLRLIDVIDGASVSRVDHGSAEWVCMALATDQALIVNGLQAVGFPVVEGGRGASAWREQAAIRIARTATGGRTWRDLPSGSRWVELRTRLAERARIAGIVTIVDPALHLLLDDGVKLWPEIEGKTCRFVLPPEQSHVVIATRSGIPARFLGVGDLRQLGIAVGSVRAESRPIPLDHWALRDGWHDAEASWRWTNGAASLLLPRRAREVTITISNPLSAYPL